MLSNFEILHEQLKEHLKQYHLLSALSTLKTMSQGLTIATVQDDIEKLAGDYRMMLNYMGKGFDDPERHHLFEVFIRRADELADAISRENELAVGTSLYARTWNTLQLMNEPHDISSINISDCSYRQIYEVFWTSKLWTQSEIDITKKWVQSAEVEHLKKCVLISAVMMAVLRHFDINKTRFLLDIYSSEDLTLRARALVGVVLVCIMWPKRLLMYEDIIARISLLADEEKFRNHLQIIQTQLFLSSVTQNLEKQLHNEILPEMMRQAQNLKQNGNLSFKDAEDLSKLLDINPHWEQPGNDDNFMQKMKSLVEMQQQGADIFIGTFKMIKSKYPFFNVAANWFCPFSKRNPEVARFLEKNKLFSKLLNNEQLCNSDKYALAFMFGDMPVFLDSIQNEELNNALEKEFSGINHLSMPLMDDERTLRIYLQDLYRYFKLFRYSENSENPFKKNLLLTENALLSAVLDDENTLGQLANFAFSQKSYHLSRQLYLRMQPSAIILQKIGYSYQIENRYEEAISAYEKARIFHENDEWTLKQLGNCYGFTNNVHAALECYLQLELINQEDTDVLLHLAECFLQLNDPKSAFQKLYKADYLSENNDDVLRGLAWCSLLDGMPEQAMAYYQRLLAKSPLPTDYLNAGHAAWISGDLPSAINRYATYLRQHEKTEDLSMILAKDNTLFYKYNLVKIDFCLMQDLVNYELGIAE